VEEAGLRFELIDAAVAGTQFMTSRQARVAYDAVVRTNPGRVSELGSAHHGLAWGWARKAPPP
jgi:hypothetical protein